MESGTQTGAPFWSEARCGEQQYFQRHSSRGDCAPELGKNSERGRGRNFSDTAHYGMDGWVRTTFRSCLTLAGRTEGRPCARLCRERVQQSTGQDVRKQTKLGQGACIASILHRSLENHDRMSSALPRSSASPRSTKASITRTGLLSPIPHRRAPSNAISLSP